MLSKENNPFSSVVISEKERKKKIKKLKIYGKRRHLTDRLSLAEAYELLGLDKYEPMKADLHLTEVLKHTNGDPFYEEDLKAAAALVKEYYFVNPFDYKVPIWKRLFC